jgi:hypothetical protein
MRGEIGRGEPPTWMVLVIILTGIAWFVDSMLTAPIKAVVAAGLVVTIGIAIRLLLTYNGVSA